MNFKFKLRNFFLLAALAYVLLTAFAIRYARHNSPLNWGHGIEGKEDIRDPFYDVEANERFHHGGHGEHGSDATDHDIHGDEEHNTDGPHGHEADGAVDHEHPATPEHAMPGGEGHEPTVPGENTHDDAGH